MCQKQVLVVDDETEVTAFFRYFLEEKSVNILEANSGRDVGRLLQELTTPIHIALVDMKLPDANGLDLLRSIKQCCPSCEVVIMTGYSTVKSAVQAIQAGARDYVEKPFDDLDDLEKMIDSILEQPSVQDSEVALAAAQCGIVCSPSGPMGKVLSLADKLAKKAINILIEGETGTGKELMARFIHQFSQRAQHPFVAINCGAIPQALLESELFGHEKGAFTGASRTRKGYFELANNGTLFLDEIGEASAGIQVKLLRVLETGEYMRVGGEEIHRTNIRIISATNRDLKEEIERKRFRVDLLYRLEGVKLVLPPLRERAEDIPLIARYHLQKKFGEEYDIAPEAVERLQNYHWPGNIRQLINILNQIIAIYECRLIREEHLPGYILDSTPSASLGSQADDFIRRETETFIKRIVDSVGSVEDINFGHVMQQMKDIEVQVGRRIIKKGLAELNGNRKLLCEKLNLTPRRLRYILNEKS
ncbi:two-component system NtrC family response regulator [Caldalkalibacillus uzonensis]|uniref:Two-component system NtrC family response regulator n=1 Tax=Caldalkalibacillus uzonensis TaxID=353224 RepID=A0ABU0CXF8_9BACI|nr:sigma-54 dependent transcriptional regulator [Caldalkalibacillus uzonensis]MDQ0339977.1 two-component system NtrC family response regulator [Caldalkalibacillus uzonensis]